MLVIDEDAYMHGSLTKKLSDRRSAQRPPEPWPRRLREYSRWESAGMLMAVGRGWRERGGGEA
jgi:hypothetical protein